MSDSHFDLLVGEDTELDDLVKKILPQYVSLNGNYEKDNADFIKKWNDEHPDTKPNPNDDGKEPSAVEKKLLERLEALEKKDAEYEASKLVSQKRSELLAKFKEKGINDSKWIDKYMNKLNLTKDSDIEQEFTDAEEFYNISHVKGGGTPGSPSGGNGDKPIGAERWAGVNKILGTSNPADK